MSKVHVVAAVICRDGRIFIAKRKASQRFGGRWEFPGGRIEGDETKEQAIIRELREEFEMRVNVVGRSIYTFEDSEFVIDFMLTQIDGVDPPALVRAHDDVTWTDWSDIAKMNRLFVPADMTFIRAMGDDGPEVKEPDYIDIVFDGPPGPTPGRFVEVE